MRTDELDYTLPPELIATHPAPRREDARLLVVQRNNPNNVAHHAIRDLPEFIKPNDALTLNDSLVLRARLRAKRADTLGKVEGLFLRHDETDPALCRLLLKSNGKLRPSQRIHLLDHDAQPSAELQLIAKHDAGEWTARLLSEDDIHTVLNRLGAVPLPPYILQARKNRDVPATPNADPNADENRYQTVYAAHPGSVAAPTAGLHLTPELLSAVRDRGASVNAVTLHVGAGTFKPIETKTLSAHPMHSERVVVPTETLRAVRAARDAGGRSIVVGTTSARALESVPQHHEADWAAETTLLIAPPYHWKRTDALLTNFHLPRSTLLAMVAALLPDGINDLLAIYSEAINHHYRFYSYGDAMLII